MPCPVVHFEIGCRDRGRTADFYAALFGWEMKPNDFSTDIKTAADAALTGHIVSLGHEPHQYTIFYVQVEDVRASLQKAIELGGKMLVPAIPIPMGTFAWIADIEGNTVGLLQPAAKS
jgi:predicted enzyme related to lactoylglutathione lyase